jgi:hypothetical protein
MVQFHTPTEMIGLQGVKIHYLRCLKKIAEFLPGLTYNCYIQKMSKPDKRYMVYDASGMKTAYHVFESKEQIEDFFEELDERGEAFDART